MKIHSLQIENFKNLKKIDFNFNRRINLFEGPAGQGKSAILSALEYPFTNFLKEKIDEWKRDNIYDFFIHEIFEHKGNLYDIEINSTKTGVNKKLIINNESSYPKLNSDATKYLATIINPALTRYSAIAEQEKTAVLLEQKPAERLRQFKEIFGIDNLMFIVEQIKNDIKENKDKVLVLESELNILRNKIFSFQDIPEIIDDEEELKFEIEKLEKEKIEYTSKLAEYAKYLNQLEAYKESQKVIIELKKEINSYVNLIEKKQSEIKKIPEYNQDKLFQLQEELNNIEKEKIIYDNKLEEYKNAQKKIRQLEVKIEKLKEDQKQYEFIKINLCEFNESNLEENQECLNNSKSELKIYNKKLELAKLGKCPECEQDYKVDIGEIEKHIGALSQSIESYISVINNIKKIINEYEEKKQQNEINKTKFENIKDNIITIQNEITELEKTDKPPEKTFVTNKYEQEIKEQKELKIEYDSVFVSNAKVNKEINEYTFTVENNKSRIIELEKIQKPNETNKVEEKDFSIINNKKESLIILQQKKQEIERIKKHNETISIEKKRNDKEISSKERKLEFLWAENRILEQCKDVMNNNFSSFVIDKGAIFIKEKMNEFFTRSYGKFQITFEQNKNKIDFFYKKENGKPRPTTMASGFERQILGISNHVALCSLQDLGLFIGDEIDSQAGAEDSQRMFEILLNEQSFNQFFLTTHSEEIKEYIQQRNDAQKFTIRNGGLK
jgi:DNA repair exonuclease SbcCD ATPase subunit